MSIKASAVLNQARAWLGRKEADGSHREIIDTYNALKPANYYKMSYTDAWCACFVSAVAMKVGASDIIPTEVGCERMIQLFKQKNAWEEKDSYVPSPGDIIFYDWQDSGAGDCTGFSDHVGIVESVVGNTITVIEGNYSDSVKRHALAVNDRYIRGYGLPKYSDRKEAEKAEPTPAPTPESKPTAAPETPAKKSVAEVAAEVRKGMWGNGAVRMSKLKTAGYDYNEVQAAVNALLRGETPAPKEEPKTDAKALEKVARDVIKGKYGNGVARTIALKAAGYDPAEVQAKVNELWKK